MTLAAPSVMASGQLKPPEVVENKYSLTAWCTRLGKKERKQTGFVAVQQQEDKTSRLGREGEKYSPDGLESACSFLGGQELFQRGKQKWSRSFSVPEGLPAWGWMESIAYHLVHIKGTF